MNTHTKLSKNLEKNKSNIMRMCSNTSDIVMSDMKSAGHRCTAMWCEGMINKHQGYELMYKHLESLNYLKFPTAEKLVCGVAQGKTQVLDAVVCDSYEELIYRIMSGCCALIVNGTDKAITTAVQGFSYRAISESYTEENVRSSREGFAEPLKVNMTLIRRRIKSPLLVFDTMNVGTVSNTEIALVYLSDRVSNAMIKSIKSRLKEIKIELVLESGYIEPFFESTRTSLFSGTGHTERPDTMCAKLLEGRVGILVDGTPFAIIIPYLFTENFQSFDDYTNKPYYASFIRIVKYVSFFVSILLPGLYVAIANYNPEIIPSGLLINIAQSQQNTPLPLAFEALFIHLVYEIVREAGLRLPRPVGHAVSLVGALVVGEAAVNAGIIGSPMVMIVALTAISSFTIPSLYEPVTFLRFVFILIGGFIGPLGITLGAFLLLINICSINTYGIPYTAPLSPFSPSALKDGLIRKSWERTNGEPTMLKQLTGAKRRDRDA